MIELGFERPTPGQGIAIALLSLAAFAYPLVGELAIERIGVSATAGVLLAIALLGMALRLAVERKPVRLLAQNAGALALLGLAVATGDRLWLQLFPALINLYLAVIFAGSLATGSSIVERGARMLEPYLPAFTRGYCECLTGLWAAFFAANAIGMAVLAAGPADVWQRYTVVGYPVAVAVLSAIELVVRKLWFRNYGAGPLDRALARFFPAESTARGRRSLAYIRRLHAAGYGPGGPLRGEPLSDESEASALRS